MAISRDDARSRHTAETGHEQFTETIYGLICAACQNYILTGISILAFRRPAPARGG